MHARGPQFTDQYIQEALVEAEQRARDGDENAAIAVQRLREFAEVLKDETKLQAALEDLHWRLCHLYWIIDKNGKKVLFVPNEHQQHLLKNIWHRNLILKARQLGYSTAIQILMLDTCLFTPNISAAVIAQDKVASRGIFRKIKFAYDNLHPFIKESHPLERESSHELILANGSRMQVATSVRSGTVNLLHISEFGKICAQYPIKAQEVVTGSLPAAHSGMIFIELTAEGREGHFYEMVQKARANSQSKKQLNSFDYRFHFAAWWEGADYRLASDTETITEAEHDYFNRIESEIGRAIDDDQRAWYIATRENAFGGDRQLMKQEYPSTPEEAFEQSQEGVYYAKQLTLARRQGRITDVPYDPRVPVNTFWDLGRDDDMVIWFHQRIDGWDNFINYFEAANEAYSFYVRHMQSLGYVWGTHYLPHDGGHRQHGAEMMKTSEEMLYDLGLRNIFVVPRTPNLTVGIRQTREAFARYRFDQTNCKEGLIHMENYRMSWNPRLGAWSETPMKNGHQHAADAIRQHAQVFVDVPAPQSRRRHKRPSGMAT